MFSVNQVLGVLEVRDEAALEQLQPSLETVAATAEKLLFAHVSDADLKRLGVDEQIIPVVRLLTSEAHLQALQSVLPDVQYTALLRARVRDDRGGGLERGRAVPPGADTTAAGRSR